ncbi:MAG TPA: DivIVA domain-containing protein [Lapillicoccus sp.]|uniref:DivIVA domain-containing protein n=1 Tax=Lapillicoccus sp. TaxID=1909287 RepID=UPI002F933E76
MIWLALFVAVVVAVITAAAVLGRVDGSLADATTTMSHVPLPDDQLTPDDIDALRFDTAMRGYRMSQVDAVIDRLRREIGDLDDELSRARQAGRALGTTATSPGSSESSESPESPDDLGGTEAERA